MEPIYVSVTGADVTVVSVPVMTAGMVGLQVVFGFDSAWEGLIKSAVFSADDLDPLCVLDITDSAPVPPELLKEGALLQVGVYGTDAEGTVVIPTIYAQVDTVRKGVEPGKDPSGNPQLPIWQQILARFEKLRPVLLPLKQGAGTDSLEQITSDISGELNDPQSEATGKAAVALQHFNKVSGNCSMAVNYDNEVEGANSFAANQSNYIGEEAENSFATGFQNVILKGFGFVAGYLNRATRKFQAVFGYRNKETDALLAVGNGKSEAERSNAFEVFSDGTIAISEQRFSAAGLQKTAAQAALISPVIDTVSGENITLKDSTKNPVQGLSVYGKSVLQGTPSKDAPAQIQVAGSGGMINVGFTTRNVFGGKALGEAVAAAGGTYKDGVASWQAKDLNGKTLVSGIFKEKTRYTIILFGKCLNLEADYTNLKVYYTDGSVLHMTPGFEKAGERSYRILRTDSSKTVGRIGFIHASGGTELEVDKCGIFEGAVTLDEFEQYGGETLALETLSGLAGIPVATGGNYTDENGQQWVCDEIDFARGVYIRRIRELVFAGTESFSKNTTNQFYLRGIAAMEGGTCLCTHFKGSARDAYLNRLNTVNCGGSFFWICAEFTTVTQLNSYLAAQYEYGTPMKVQYVLSKPEEMPLNEDVRNAYKAMTTCTAETKVYTDCGAGVAVSYVADTKKYIDRKFNELAAVIVNNT